MYRMNKGLRYTLRTALARYLLWCGLVLIGNPAYAAPDDRKQPIQLVADSVSMDEGQRTSVYRGQVELRQGSLWVRADQVRVQHDKNNKPIKLIAVGSPARFQQGTADAIVKASAKRAEYVVRSAQLTLSGDATLIQAGDTIESDRIVYNRQQNILKAGNAADGKQRVQIMLQAPDS